MEGLVGEAVHMIWRFQWPYLLAIVILSLLEGAYLSGVKKARFDWYQYLISYGMNTVRIILDMMIPFSVAAPILTWLWLHRVTTISIDAWWALALLFIGQEFFYYWFHRIAHENRWFWATHFPHHTGTEYNLSLAFRLGWTDRFSGNLLFLAPMIWLGFPPVAVFAAFLLTNSYQIWLHTELIPKLGWLEYVLNTPSHHRVHHANDDAYFNANYGGVLIIFDRLFGTCIVERDDQPCHYGLAEPFHTYNPLRIVFQGWFGLFSDLARAGGWRQRAALLFSRENTSRARRTPALQQGNA